MRPTLAIVSLAAVLIFVGGLVCFSSPILATHNAAWEPSLLTRELVAGETLNVPISVTAEGSALPNAVVEVSPELVGLVTISPSDLGTIPNRKSVVLAITFTPPITAKQGTIEGTISLHKKATSGEIFSPPLKVILTIKWPGVVNDGVAVIYPADWGVDQKTMNLSETIRLTNFGAAYLNGGIVPEGGAQISIPVVPLPDAPLETIISQDTDGDKVISQRALIVDGNPATEVTSEIGLGEDLTYRRITVYVPRGAQLNKFILDYRSGDSREATFLQTFNQLLNSATLN